jgi:Cu/Ag efflux pump CusA
VQHDPARLIGIPSLVAPTSIRVADEAFDTEMVVSGLLERLAPVLVTALVNAVALAPLLLEAESPSAAVLRPPRACATARRRSTVV